MTLVGFVRKPLPVGNAMARSGCSSHFDKRMIRAGEHPVGFELYSVLLLTGWDDELPRKYGHKPPISITLIHD
jgi:hypothetical protein